LRGNTRRRRAVREGGADLLKKEAGTFLSAQRKRPERKNRTTENPKVHSRGKEF